MSNEVEVTLSDEEQHTLVYLHVGSFSQVSQDVFVEYFNKHQDLVQALYQAVLNEGINTCLAEVVDRYKNNETL